MSRRFSTTSLTSERPVCNDTATIGHRSANFWTNVQSGVSVMTCSDPITRRKQGQSVANTASDTDLQRFSLTRTGPVQLC